MNPADRLAQLIIDMSHDYAQSILAVAGGLLVIGLIGHLVMFELGY
jgi:hypothetical protein